jgi:hypothetical protein
MAKRDAKTSFVVTPTRPGPDTMSVKYRTKGGRGQT